MDYKQFAKKNLRRILYRIQSRGRHKDYAGRLKYSGLRNKACPGEEAWREKWGVLGKKVDPIYYRLFYPYIGPCAGIVPVDICRGVIEPLLNPPCYTRYIADKNVFDRLFPSGTLPRTILRKIDSIYYDASYRRLELDDAKLSSLLNEAGETRLVVKPTIGGWGGIGVQLFARQNHEWYDAENKARLDYDYLTRRCADNLIVQECLEQDDYIAQFNPTSVNTIRLSMYRSVKDDRWQLIGAVIRMGSKGSVVDNAHMGGRYAGIRPDGTLCNTTFDLWGRSQSRFNGHDFSRHYQIPDFDKIVEFAKQIGAYVYRERLLALDIMVDKAHNPRLIEFNAEEYSVALYQFSTGAAFGPYTDEIIAYCRERLERIPYSLSI